MLIGRADTSKMLAPARGLLNNTTFPINDRKKSFEITIIIKDEALELPPYFKL